jgi:hypothetical protein
MSVSCLINVASWPIVRLHKSKRAEKKWSGRTNLRPNFRRFRTEKAEKGQTFRKCILTSLFTLILGRSRKYYTFATDKDKDNFYV